MLPINPSLLTINLHSRVITSPTHNDAQQSFSVIMLVPSSTVYTACCYIDTLHFTVFSTYILPVIPTINTDFVLRNIKPHILIRSNKVQQYAGIYLLQNYSTCFGCPSHPSSGVHKTLTAASGTSHITYLSNSLPQTWQNLATLEEGCCSDTMTCTRGCSYSFMYS